MGQGQAGSGTAFVSALATAAMAATQVARMAKATETTVGVAKRARDKVLENQGLLLGLMLGALGLGLILGFMMRRSRKKADVLEEPIPEVSKPEAVPDPAAANPTDSTEASG